MRIALVQVAATTDPAANLEIVRTRAADAASRGAELVVFPDYIHETLRGQTDIMLPWLVAELM